MIGAERKTARKKPILGEASDYKTELDLWGLILQRERRVKRALHSAITLEAKHGRGITSNSPFRPSLLSITLLSTVTRRQSIDHVLLNSE